MPSVAGSIPSMAGNLALAYQETLTPIVRLRSGRQSVQDAAYFREQFVDALKLAKEEARSGGYNDTEIRDGRFAVVAFLDETILNMQNPVFADWVRRPLQEELFGVHVGGEVFFQNVDRLIREPDAPRLADVLELYLLCLCLGYAGKYSLSSRGELDALRQSLGGRIRRIRGDAPELAPGWRPTGALSAARKDRLTRPLLWATVGAVGLAAALFVVYLLSLNAAISPLQSLASAAGAGR